MIAQFSGQHAFLSNFYCNPEIARRLYGYQSVEHFFQAMKTTDRVQRAAFKGFDITAGQAKRRGRRLILRPDWEEIKVDVMRTGIEIKFAPDTSLGRSLINTGERFLLEGNNWHDNFWGSCMCSICLDTEGQNMLGFLLMEQRTKLTGERF